MKKANAAPRPAPREDRAAGPCVTYAARGSSVWSLSLPGSLEGAHRCLAVSFMWFLKRCSPGTSLVVSSSSLISLGLSLSSLPPLGSPRLPANVPCAPFLSPRLVPLSYSRWRDPHVPSSHRGIGGSAESLNNQFLLWEFHLHNESAGPGISCHRFRSSELIIYSVLIEGEPNRSPVVEEAKVQLTWDDRGRRPWGLSAHLSLLPGSTCRLEHGLARVCAKRVQNVWWHVLLPGLDSMGRVCKHYEDSGQSSDRRSEETPATCTAPGEDAALGPRRPRPLRGQLLGSEARLGDYSVTWCAVVGT